MRNKLVSLLLAAALFHLAIAAQAQYKVLHGTFGNGGGVRGNGDNIVYDTAGQPIIGVSSGGPNIIKAGFWYTVGISSTLDVAFTSFFGDLKDDAVLLMWSVSASSSFEGFNVYRSSGDEDAFTQINKELIRPVKAASYRDDTALPGASYLYRIGAVSGEIEWSSQTISIVLPSKPTTLYQNYPNPFNPSTSIAFYLPVQQRVELIIYDVNGAKVRTVVDGIKPVGKHVLSWNGRNDAGVQVSSGVYWYRLKAGKEVITKKLVVIR